MDRILPIPLVCCAAVQRPCALVIRIDFDVRVHSRNDVRVVVSTTVRTRGIGRTPIAVAAAISPLDLIARGSRRLGQGLEPEPRVGAAACDVVVVAEPQRPDFLQRAFLAACRPGPQLQQLLGRGPQRFQIEIALPGEVPINRRRCDARGASDVLCAGAGIAPSANAAWAPSRTIRLRSPASRFGARCFIAVRDVEWRDEPPLNWSTVRAIVHVSS